MIKPVLFCFFICFTFLSLNAQQNLVPNGSFEEYSECPISAEMNNGQFERCKGWWSPTDCTPDYFNRCSNNIGTWNSVWIPNNFWGYQKPFDGNAYVGLGSISWNSKGENLGNEYIRTKLLTPLCSGKKYKLSLYVSLANKSTHAIGKLAVCVSNENNSTFGCEFLLCNSICIQNNNFLADTMNWMKIEGVFIADGLEKYLTIGYFHNDITNDTIVLQSWDSEFFGSYYYIDSISLYEVEYENSSDCNYQIEIPNVFTPNNDGVNDVLDLSEYVDFIENIRIINRWGNTVKVFTKNDPIWDGGNCVDGIYYYLIEDEKFKTKQTGFIHLVR